jgi:hypothetical protein
MSGLGTSVAKRDIKYARRVRNGTLFTEEI